MNSRDAVTTLTQQGLHLIIDQQKKNVVVAQILEPEVIQTTRMEKSSLKYKVIISDGRAKHKAVLGNDAATTFESLGSPPFSVVRVVDLMMPQQQQKRLIPRLVLITKIEMLYKDIKEIIGNPIEYQDWLDTDGLKKPGSVPIPSKYLASIKPSNPQPSNNQSNYSEFSPGPTRQSNGSLNQAPNQATSSNYVNMNQNRNVQQPQQNFQQQNFNSGNQPNRFSGNQNVGNTNQNFGNNNANKQNQPIKKSNTGPVSFTNPNIQNIQEDEFMSLKQLAPFSPFTIKARVTQKSDLKTFNKGAGENHVFSCELVDKDGNDIGASFFGEAAEHYYNLLEENKVYILMNGGTVKMANAKYNRTKSEYQIVFERRDANIIPTEDTGDIQKQKFDFTSLSEVPNKENNSTIDVAVFIKEFGMASEVQLKNGGSKARRVVYIFDDSNMVFELTLWGDLATDFPFKQDELVLMKGIRVTEFGGKKTLSNGFSTKILNDLNIVQSDQRVNSLISWRKNDFNADNLEQVSTSTGGEHAFMKHQYTLEEVINESQNLTGDGKAFFDCRVHVQHIKTEGTLFYAACTQGTCGKKVNKNPTDNTWTCGSCNVTIPSPNYRYTLNVKIADTTNSIWASAFDRVGQTLVERDANDLNILKEQSDDAQLKDILSQAHNQEFDVRIMSKVDNYMGDSRMRYQILRIKKVAFLDDSNLILKLLGEYSALK